VYWFSAASIFSFYQVKSVMSKQQYDRLLVLVVDDNHYMRTIVSAMLRSIGITQIREASDGAEALGLCKDWRPDLIIMDLVMDQLDGLETARLIRTAKDSAVPHVPIIMMSGHADRRTVMEARDAGINEFVVKPMTAKALIDRITKLVNSDRAWIKCKNYTGPDRRRKHPPAYSGVMRRQMDAKIEI